MIDDEQVRHDFDVIARLGERHDSGSDRFDAFLLRQIPQDAVHILDVGCGLGRLTRKLARADRTVIGVDLSPAMVERARAASATSPGVEFVCGDFLSFDLGTAAFDCIVTSAALHHMPAAAALLRMRALLRPGGRLVVHDLRASTGIIDDLVAASTLAGEALRRLLRTGWPLSPRHVRRAWSQHGARETYATRADIESLIQRCLEGARLHWHRGWRYTVIWDNR